jgi:hypothetical protein
VSSSSWSARCGRGQHHDGSVSFQTCSALTGRPSRGGKPSGATTFPARRSGSWRVLASCPLSRLSRCRYRSSRRSGAATIPIKTGCGSCAFCRPCRSRAVLRSTSRDNQNFPAEDASPKVLIKLASSHQELSRRVSRPRHLKVALILRWPHTARRTLCRSARTDMVEAAQPIALQERFLARPGRIGHCPRPRLIFAIVLGARSRRLIGGEVHAGHRVASVLATQSRGATAVQFGLWHGAHTSEAP